MYELLKKPEAIRDIRAGLADEHCVLCGGDIQTSIDEMVCPHWFVAVGRMAFKLRHLVKVFRLYDLDSVIEYLKIVSQPESVGDPLMPVVEVLSAEARSVTISWRRRRWEFKQDCRPDGNFSTDNFLLSTFYSGDLVETGRVLRDVSRGSVTLEMISHSASSPVGKDKLVPVPTPSPLPRADAAALYPQHRHTNICTKMCYGALQDMFREH